MEEFAVIVALVANAMIAVIVVLAFIAVVPNVFAILVQNR